MVKNPYENYTKNKIYTASKAELTMMLYDGALKFNNQAIMAIESQNMEQANEYILRVQDIIREFQITLDYKYDVANNYAAMYDYIYRLLIDANIKKDPEILKEAGDFIRELRDLWKEVMKAAISA